MTLEVHVGLDDWLFLSGGSNEVLKYYATPDFFNQAKSVWLELLRSRREKAEQRGIIYRHMTVPDKLSIYQEFYRDPLLYLENPPTAALPRLLSGQPDAAALQPLLIDVKARMLAAKAGGAQLYFKTDAHWTFEGCWEAYLALCASLQAAPNHSFLEAQTTTGNLFLDLGSKLSPPVSEPYVVKHFIKGAQRTFANELIAYKERENAHDAPGLHVGSHIMFRNESTATDPRTIVLFGDSYSEYRTHMLTGLLAETFAETHFIWNASIDWAYVDRVKADIVVTEMAERFMNLVPNDTLDVHAFARERMAAFLAQRA